MKSSMRGINSRRGRVVGKDERKKNNPDEIIKLWRDSMPEVGREGFGKEKVIESGAIIAASKVPRKNSLPCHRVSRRRIVAVSRPALGTLDHLSDNAPYRDTIRGACLKSVCFPQNRLLQTHLHTLAFHATITTVASFSALRANVVSSRTVTFS
jgi:hypothetical protein